MLAPVVPSKVVAVGLNYRAHAAELAMQVQAEPILFLKPPTAVIGPGEAIVARPPRARSTTRPSSPLSWGGAAGLWRPASAAAAVAGYTCGNDVTARDLQKIDGQWTRAKSFDTFCPLGPAVVRDARRPKRP